MDVQQHQDEVDKLSEKADHYKRNIIEEYSKYYQRSGMNIVAHNVLQICILVGAAVVPFLLIIPSIPKLVPTIISGVVAVAVAISNYYKFGERGRIDRLTAQELHQEYNLYDTERGDYKSKTSKEALDLFLDRTEAILDKHNQRFPSPGVTIQNQNQY
jgi:hypothetical protein